MTPTDQLVDSIRYQWGKLFKPIFTIFKLIYDYPISSLIAVIVFLVVYTAGTSLYSKIKENNLMSDKLNCQITIDELKDNHDPRLAEIEKKCAEVYKKYEDYKNQQQIDKLNQRIESIGG